LRRFKVIVAAKASKWHDRWPPFKRWLQSCGPAGGHWISPWVAKSLCCTGLISEHQGCSPQALGRDFQGNSRYQHFLLKKYFACMAQLLVQKAALMD
jgi:hypothetical protein